MYERAREKKKKNIVGVLKTKTDVSSRPVFQTNGTVSVEEFVMFIHKYLAHILFYSVPE